MRRSRSALTPALAALALALPAAAVPAVAVPAGGTASMATTASPVPVASAASTSPRTALTSTRQAVRLITGDTVRLTGAASTLVPAPGSQGGYRHAVIGGHDYVIPDVVASLVGRQLDPSLFDVATIAATSGGEATPVTVTYASTTSPSAVPGVEIRSRSGRSATGVVTAASSAALARALRTTPAATVYAGVSRVAAAAPTAAPAYPMHTVRFGCLDMRGERTECTVIATNVEEVARGSAFASTYKREARASLPSGHYWLVAWVQRGTGTAMPQIAETEITGDATYLLDARTATTPVTVRFPDPTDGAFTTVDIGRTDEAGSGASSVGVWALGESRTWVTPVAGLPAHGTIGHSVASIQNEPRTRPRYQYAAAWTGAGVPSTMLFAPRRTDLEMTAMTYRGTTALSGLTGLVSTTVSSPSGGIGLGLGLPLPSRRTVYAAGTPGVTLSGDYQSSYDFDTDTDRGTEYLTSMPRRVVPGTTRSEEWNREPSHPTILPLGTLWGPVCGACVQGSTVSLAVPSFGDNDPLHWGLVDDPSTVSWSVEVPGQQLASGQGPLVTAVSVPPGATRLLASSTETRPRADGTSSTTTTTWSTSLDSRGPASVDPAACAGDPDTPCAPLGMLQARYRLPIQVDRTIAPGTAQGRVDVTAYGTASAVASLALDVRYAGGMWLHATTRPISPTAYAVVLPISAGGGEASLRLRVTDTAGSTLTQVIDGAFRVAP